MVGLCPCFTSAAQSSSLETIFMADRGRLIINLILQGERVHILYITIYCQDVPFPVRCLPHTSPGIQADILLWFFGLLPVNSSRQKPPCFMIKTRVFNQGITNRLLINLVTECLLLLMLQSCNVVTLLLVSCWLRILAAALSLLWVGKSQQSN